MLAGLLWSDVSEATARTNLRQLLRRLKESLPPLVTAQGDWLHLVAGLEVDVACLEAVCEDQGGAVIASLPGELLAGHSYDDCPDLNGWLGQQGERLQRLRTSLERSAIARLEKSGRLVEALELAQRVYERDPASEEDCRLLMRLHHLNGNRHASFFVYRRCETALRDELGVAPSPDTRRLLREIEQGGMRLPSLPPPRPVVPLSVMQPPMLVGRARQWEILEEAYAQGGSAVVMGAAGLGKTRLITDFARSKGSWLLLTARPGDQTIPYATQARSMRALLAHSPQVSLDALTRRELSRLLPELRGRELALPLPGPNEKLRFFQALADFFVRAVEDVEVIVFDDVHHGDSSSFELWMYFVEHLRTSMGAGQAPLVIISGRQEELPPDLSGAFQRLVESGHHAVTLEPLSQAQVHEMLRGMAPGRLDTLSKEFSRYTGGNPLFVVETARHLLESERFDGGWPRDMAPPGRVVHVMARRFERLSFNARRLLHAMAITQQDFSLELAGALMNMPIDLLREPWRELEQAHVIQHDGFSQEWVGKVALEATPAALREALNRQVEQLLSQQRGWGRSSVP
jgi:DNA-binding SARP family transcriptional activator